MIITITGTASSGKTTLAKLLAKKLGYKHYSIGDMRKKMAEERGISLAELNRRSETGEEDTDTPVDEFQRKLGETSDNFVTDGRTGFHFIPHSKKVLLDADERTRAERMFHRGLKVEGAKNVVEAQQLIHERHEGDRRRYIKLYGFDVWDPKHYDLVLDSTEKTPEQLVEMVLGKFSLKEKPF